MTDLLLRILGWHSDDVQRMSGWGVGLGNTGALLWALPLAVVLSVVVIWSYRKIAREHSGTKPALLSALRIVLLVLLLVLFLRPVLGFTAESAVRRAVVVLFDTSASMRIEDARSSPEDRVRSAVASGQLDARKGLTQDVPVGASGLNLPRQKLVQLALANPQIDLLRRLEAQFDVRVMTFGQRTTGIDTAAPDGAPVFPPAWINQLDTTAPATATGDAIREVLTASRGQQLGGIVVVSDGGLNSGLPGTAAAQLARQEGVPLFLWGVGVSNVLDVIVPELFAPDVVFKDDEVPVTVRVRNRGLAGQTVTVALTLNDTKVAEQSIVLDPAGEQTVALTFTPKSPGEFKLSATASPRDDEAVKDNNTASQALRVVDGKLKVLYVEQSPRYEYHFLSTALLRDRRVEAKIFLVEADKAIAGPGTPYLSAFPTQREELFKYNLVILGDVDPRALGDDALKMLDEHVGQFGGGFLMIAGRRHAPAAYVGTPLARLLPVDVPPSSRVAFNPRTAKPDDKPLPVELTPAGKQSDVLKLLDDPAANQRLWASRRPLYWAFGGATPKPAAEVLMEFVDTRVGGRTGKTPLIALQQFGAGTTAFVGSDNLWRWRADNGDSVYVKFWGQMVQRLALPHFLGASPRTRLTSERRSYAVFDRVVIFARLYDQSFRPIVEPSMRGNYQTAQGQRNEVPLQPVPDQPGLYRAEFPATEIGQVQFWVDRDVDTKLDFTVTEPKLEFADTAMNETLLRQMATASGGAFVREEDLHTLPDQLQAKNELVKSRVEIELAFTPLYFALLMIVAGTEWFVRKRVQLK